jgi:hypothetical protein
MANKTFKIGEYCKGGIIQVKVNEKTKDVIVIGKEWDFSKGSNKGSNQSNAKEWTRKKVNADNSTAKRELIFFLSDLTTSYYTDKVIEWIEEKVEFKQTWGCW